MKNRILCSTGALIGKPNGRDFRLLKELAEKLDCDGFEFMMYSDWYDKIEEIISFLKEKEMLNRQVRYIRECVTVKEE